MSAVQLSTINLRSDKCIQMRDSADMTVEEFKLELRRLWEKTIYVEPLVKTRENAKRTRTYINSRPGKKPPRYTLVNARVVNEIKIRL